MPSLHVLFVCSKNQWRSPTAERIYRNHARVEVRSAGTARSARRTVSAHDLEWADTVLVMEDQHLSRLHAYFPHHMRHLPCHVLHISDSYRCMDPELIEEIRSAVDPLLDDALGGET